MNKQNLDDAMNGMKVVLTDLLATLAGNTGAVSAQTRYLCGWLQSYGRTTLNQGGPQFWIILATAFEAARMAGASFVDMERVRADAAALTTSTLAGVAMKNFSVRMALLEQSRILAATTFVSRQDIDSYFDTINNSFDAASLIAADALDNIVYTLLISLHAAVSNDLANRARPLPLMVTYTFPQPKPSLWISQTLYQDGSRGDELVAENKPIHPLFMPLTGNALSE